MEHRLKQHRRYIFYRIYVPAVFVAFLIWQVPWFISATTNQEPSVNQNIAFGILFPCFGIMVFMVMNLFVFPFKFSIFGTLERSPLPDEQPILKIAGSCGGIGLFRASIPFVSWLVYPTGLGISILGIGKVFIPAEQIKKVNIEKNLASFTGPYRLQHNSPELYNPVCFSDSKLFKALKVILPEETSA